MTDKKTYEAIIRVRMPGRAKDEDYKIPVEADDPTEAQMKATDAWIAATKIRDIRVKEIETKSEAQV